MKHFRYYILTLLISLLLLLGDSVFRDSFVRRFIERGIMPLQTAIYSTGIRYINVITTLDDLYVENEQLRQQVREYFATKIENERLLAQNKLLRSLLEIPERSGEIVTVANVLGTRNIGSNVGLVLNVGINEGVGQDDAVLFEGALIGRITEVSEDKSIVLPMMANDSKVPVRAIGAEPFTGLAEGSFNTGVRLAQVVAPADALEQGVEVYTSGLGGTYPADIFVGTLRDVESTDNDVFKSAIISIPWKLTELDAVAIISAI